MDPKVKLASFPYFYILLIIPVTLGVTSCPGSLTVEMGTNQSIFCESDPNYVDFYWYRGPARGSDLVCKLDHGVKRVSSKYQGFYDISDSGALIILHCTLQHEFLYTLVTFDWSGISQESSVLVNVTVSPKPPCLVISGCKPCEPCYLSVSKKSGSLNCSVIGSRPSIPLNWRITSHHGISFIKHQQNEEGETRYTRSTSVLLEYKITKYCGVREVFHCEAQDSLKVLDSNVASVEISNDPCADVDAGFSSRKRRILIICLLIFITVITMLTFILCLWRRRNSDSEISGGRDDLQGMPLLQEQPMLKVLPASDQKASFIASVLAKNYMKHCSVQPLPWGEDIPINALYTDCQCTVTTRHGMTYSVTSNELLTGGYIINEKRVIIIGALGFGKTTFTKQVVNNWIQSRRKFLLLYIRLKDVKRDMTLSEIVSSQLIAYEKVTEDDIASIISQYGCLLLLDGLEEFSITMKNGSCTEKYMSDPQAEQKEKDERSAISLTVEQILKGDTKGKDEHIQIWVTSREIDYVNSAFPNPYIRVKMNGFSTEQAEDYINKACRLYHPPKRIDTSSEPDEKLRHRTGNPTLFYDARTDGNSSIALITEDDKDNKSETNMKNADKGGAEGGVISAKLTKKKDVNVEWKKVADKIKQFLDNNDVLLSFKTTPLLFILMVHIIAAKYTFAVSHPETLAIDKLTDLIGTVLSCLKSRYGKNIHKESSEEISFLENKLGETALRHNLQVKGMDREFWIQEIGEKYVKMALDIGYLQQSTNTAVSSKKTKRIAFSSFNGIEFYDELFEAYLAACFVMNNSENMHQLMNLVSSAEEYETFRVLQFLCGLDESKVEDVFRRLLKLKKYNSLIDCLYEVNDQEEYEEVLKTIRNSTLHIAYLDRSYHMNSFSAFCEKCNELGVKLTSVVFHSSCTISYLTTLNLPEVDRLEFVRVALDTEEFLSFLKWLPGQRVDNFVRFLECKIPTKINEAYALQEVRSAKQDKVLIYRKKHMADPTHLLFKYSSGTWKWRPWTFEI